MEAKMLVRKRNGEIQEFDNKKIYNAMKAAVLSKYNELDSKTDSILKRITKEIKSENKDKEIIDIEDIQNMVEDKLMGSRLKEVAREYIRYRYKKEVLRRSNTTDASLFELLSGTSDYWNNENANKNAKSVTTQRDYIAGITSTDITKRFLLDKDIVEAHEKGIIHFHDADYFAQAALHNCFSIDTRFITSTGVKSFRDFKEGDEVLVPTHTGEWKKGIVKKYGKQELYKYTFKRGHGKEKIVYATENHRWILKDGSVTTSLKIGDQLIKTPIIAGIDFETATLQSYWTVINKQYHGIEEVWCLEVEDNHSFILEGGITTGNCELVNLEDILQNGTVVNGVMIEKPHRLITAATIATQIILAVTSSSYGGCTVSLTHLAPFVRDSYNFHLNRYLQRNFNKEEAERYAKEDLAKEVKDAVQTFNYQVNSMTNTNGQAPFLSVNMYLGETTEYKEELAMLIEEFLKQRILGFKNEQGVYITPAFPKLLYVLEEDNIHEGSKYWYLTKLAAECTAKRMVPDYISEKVMKANKINKEGVGECYPAMGECKLQLM